jgi:hypothetical protein
MPATHNIVVAEEYEGRDGTKTKWTTIGVVIETEKDGKKRKSIKLNLIPTGWDGFASVFPIDRERKDNRRDAGPEDGDASDEMNQQHPPADVPITDIGDEPINLDDIPF